MEEGGRSGEPSGYVVKNRNSSGCLIVRKKGVGGGGDGVGGGVGSSGAHKLFDSRKEKKRHRVEFSDSGSSDEIYLQPRRKVGPETLKVRNGSSRYDKGGVLGESDVVRKRSRGEEFRHNEVGGFGRNGEDLSDKKRNKLDVYDFDEYDGSDGIMMRREHFDDVGMDGRRFFGSSMMSRSGAEREYEMGSSRHAVADGRKNSYFERTSGLSRGDLYDRDGARRPISFLRDNHDSDGPIRVQGKNGVLKVMVNKKKKIGGSSNIYDRLEAEGRKDLRTEDIVKRNAPIRPAYYSEPKVVEKASSFVGTEKNPMNLLKSSSTKNSKRRHHDPDDSDTSLKLGLKSAEAYNNMKTPVSTKNSVGQDMSSEDSDTSLKLGRKDVEVRKSMKGMSGAGEITPSNELLDPKLKGGKVKRGSGTEKQKLRERIRGMLLENGWTIDYRPRRNRDYLDAVYINPSGTAYWSIIKAYDALLKQLNDEEDEAAAAVDGSSFAPLSDEVLSQLTRKTRKKIEKEMKKKPRDGGESKNAKEATMRKPTGIKHDDESMDSGSREEKLSSYVKQGGKSSKSRINGDDSVSINSKGQSSAQNVHDVTEKPALGPSSHHGRKSKKLGRCTLLVRNSNEVFNSEKDGFVPYSGKRTVLSWLIDSGTVQPSQKVRYMNRRRTKVMQEGWITREGIHCGCCSKILTVSKFEIHAASKLRQPFQNIYLDSGVSLLECQIDAWNRQDSIEHIGFHSVDTDGDDPNDDTCGLCGDGGDLICCDGCPSTFHQSCLDIKMLPPGEWHCPNCTCKFCRLASENFVEGDDTIVSTLHTCSLCLKKFHKRCMQEKDGLSSQASSLDSSFCGKKCRQLFDQLHKFLGVKHELEAGFSWSLIHRTDADLDATFQGLPQRIESNSKLAVALSVMDECFLPVVDRRSGVNLIRNVLYNCSSNFSRLNYSGFYTAILERGDDIISAASIRFHGTRLAEMPFIGTRHIYRRQGMCRRLFGAIESALCTLKVEKLIIPAISELTHTWTEIFGFTTLNASLKQELKSMNMLVFPGIDMLQKQLLEQENTDGKKAIATGIKLMESKDSQFVTPGLASKCKSNVDSSAEQDSPVCANDGPGHASETNEEAPADNSDSQCLGVSLNDASVMSGSLDFCPERKSPVPLREKKNADSESGEKLDESALEKKGPCISDSSHEVREMDEKPQSDSPVEDNCQSHIQGDVGSSSRCPDASFDNGSDVSGCLDTSHELKNAISLQGGICVDSASTNKLAESVPCDNKDENGSELPSPGKDNPQSSTEGDVDDSPVMDPNEFASAEVKPSISLQGNTCADAPSEDKFGKLAAHDECPSNLHVTDVVEMETKPALNSIGESRNRSCKECNLGDAGTIKVDMPSAEAPPSTLDRSTENSGEKIYEISGKFDDGDESSMQVDFAPHTEAACEKQSESDGASGGVPEATH